MNGLRRTPYRDLRRQRSAVAEATAPLADYLRTADAPTAVRNAVKSDVEGGLSPAPPQALYQDADANQTITTAETWFSFPAATFSEFSYPILETDGTGSYIVAMPGDTEKRNLTVTLGFRVDTPLLLCSVLRVFVARYFDGGENDGDLDTTFGHQDFMFASSLTDGFADAAAVYGRVIFLQPGFKYRFGACTGRGSVKRRATSLLINREN